MLQENKNVELINCKEVTIKDVIFSYLKNLSVIVTLIIFGIFVSNFFKIESDSIILTYFEITVYILLFTVNGKSFIPISQQIISGEKTKVEIVNDTITNIINSLSAFILIIITNIKTWHFNLLILFIEH